MYLNRYTGVLLLVLNFSGAMDKKCSGNEVGGTYGSLDQYAECILGKEGDKRKFARLCFYVNTVIERTEAEKTKVKSEDQDEIKNIKDQNDSYINGARKIYENLGYTFKAAVPKDIIAFMQLYEKSYCMKKVKENLYDR